MLTRVCYFSLKDLRKLEAEKAKEMAMPPPLPGTAV